ncbi:tetratricopeptide repeat protein [Pontibacter korlensis]|uniref:Uncharacterized protein n=1 Tax=Pontibacter korlensis TaxID=400092 RepID=A0A0E3ZF78_9BACT|nr:tetratricopeptide repeat protein [Pontibacter korlensis]AKD04145.1 hypothetical protein PKOR_14905 [Pontibacter korlensis]
MKAALSLAILLISIFSGGISVITRINQHAQQAAVAYNRADYIEAIASYEYLIDDLEVEDDQLRLNLAHSYYQAGLLPQATAAYQYLADHPTARLRALAHLQLGNIFTKQKRYKRALALYKQSLVIEPENDAARYNYELLKKYLELHPEVTEPEKQKENVAEDELPSEQDSLQSPPPAEENLEPKPKQNPDPEGEQQETETPEPDQNGQKQQQTGGTKDQEQGSKEREQSAGDTQGDEQGQLLNSLFDPSRQQRPQSSEPLSDEDQRAQMRRARLRQANISPEKAKILLDAMRNAELQYIQQLPKKPTRQPDRSKPDW